MPNSRAHSSKVMRTWDKNCPDAAIVKCVQEAGKDCQLAQYGLACLPTQLSLIWEAQEVAEDIWVTGRHEQL